MGYGVCGVEARHVRGAATGDSAGMIPDFRFEGVPMAQSHTYVDNDVGKPLGKICSYIWLTNKI